RCESREHRKIERLIFQIVGPCWNGFAFIRKFPRIVGSLSMTCVCEGKRQEKGAGELPNSRLHLLVPGGVSRARARRRAPFGIARDELLIEIDARLTAATSAPTLNGSRMSLPLNCWANSGGSTEK